MSGSAMVMATRRVWGMGSASASASASSIRCILLAVSTMAMVKAIAPTRATIASRAPRPEALRTPRRCGRNLPSSAPAQHAGGIAAVVEDDGRRIRVLRLAAEPRGGAAGCGERPGRRVALLDRRPAAGAARGDDGGVAGPRQLDAFERGRGD